MQRINSIAWYYLLPHGMASLSRSGVSRATEGDREIPSRPMIPATGLVPVALADEASALLESKRLPNESDTSLILRVEESLRLNRSTFLKARSHSHD